MLTLKTIDLKHIYDVCAPHVSKDNSKPLLKFIQLRIERQILTATACNYATLAQTKIDLGEGVDDVEYYIPVVKIPKAQLVVIDNTPENEITLDFITTKFTERKPAGEFLDWKKVINCCSQSQYVIGVDPKLMIQSLQSFKTGAVKITFGDSLAPFTFTTTNGSHDFVLQLPCRLKKEGD